MIFSYLLNMQSHPSWVCGLKQYRTLIKNNPSKSHPSWVCGLKHSLTQGLLKSWSHTLRGCVD